MSEDMHKNQPATRNTDPVGALVERLIAQIAHELGLEPNELVEGDRARKIKAGRMALARALVGRLEKPSVKIELSGTHRRIFEERAKIRLLQREKLSQSIISAISRTFFISRTIMEVKGRARPIVRARQAAAYLLLRASFTQDEVATIFHQNRLTIRYAAQRAAEILADNSDPPFVKKLRMLEKRFFHDTL